MRRRKLDRDLKKKKKTTRRLCTCVLVYLLRCELNGVAEVSVVREALRQRLSTHLNEIPAQFRVKINAF
jgi:hypothetical protein